MDRKAFDAWCADQNIEPTEDRWGVWYAALQSTRNQPVAAYCYFGPGQEILQMVDFIEPNRKPLPTPLYAAPMACVPKPDVSVETLKHVWTQYYASDGDLMGMLLWLQRYIKS